MHKAADIDKDTVLKYLAAGLLTGGGLGAAISAINFAAQPARDIKRRREEEQQGVMRIKLPPKAAPEKKAELIKMGDPRTLALSILAFLGGTGAGYGTVRDIYQKGRRKELETELDRAQNVYLQNLPQPKTAAHKHFSTLDYVAGIPMAAWLVAAIGSGYISNRVLKNVMEQREQKFKPEPPAQPKRVIVEQADAPKENTETPERSTKMGSHLPITEAHVRHMIKMAIAIDTLSGNYDWLVASGLLDAAVMHKHGGDVKMALAATGPHTSFQDACFPYLATHDIAAADFYEAGRNPALFLSKDFNRQYLNEAAAIDLEKTAAAIAEHSMAKHATICRLAEKVHVGAIWDLIPEFVAADDAECPVEKWADVGGIKNILATKALYDAVVKPMVVGREEEQAHEEQSAPEANKPQEPVKKEEPTIEGKDPESKDFVNRNKKKIEEVIDKAAAVKAAARGDYMLRALMSAPHALPRIAEALQGGGDIGSDITRVADELRAYRNAIKDPLKRRLNLLPEKMVPVSALQDLTGWANPKTQGYHALYRGENPMSTVTGSPGLAERAYAYRGHRAADLFHDPRLDPSYRPWMPYADIVNKASSALDGVAEGKSVKVPEKEMAIGKKVESEHSSNPKVQEKIVKDHEVEEKELTGAPQYYQGGAKALFADIAKAQAELKRGAAGETPEEIEFRGGANKVMKTQEGGAPTAQAPAGPGAFQVPWYDQPAQGITNLLMGTKTPKTPAPAPQLAQVPAPATKGAALGLDMIPGASNVQKLVAEAMKVLPDIPMMGAKKPVQYGPEEMRLIENRTKEMAEKGKLTLSQAKSRVMHPEKFKKKKASDVAAEIQAGIFQSLAMAI